MQHDKTHTLLLFGLLLLATQSARSMQDMPQELVDTICRIVKHKQTSVQWLAQCLTAARVCSIWRKRIAPQVRVFTQQSVQAKTMLLYKAVEMENHDAVSFLLNAQAAMHCSIEVPAEFTVCDDYGICRMAYRYDSAWSRAISLGNTKTVSCMIRHGACVNEIIEKNHIKNTALKIACLQNNVPLQALLLSHGATDLVIDSDESEEEVMYVAGFVNGELILTTNPNECI